MARIEKVRNAKYSSTDYYKKSLWKPTTGQIGLGAAALGGLGALGYAASAYPKQSTKLAQKALGGLISGLPIISSQVASGNMPTRYIGEKILSNFLPFGAVIN